MNLFCSFIYKQINSHLPSQFFVVFLTIKFHENLLFFYNFILDELRRLFVLQFPKENRYNTLRIRSIYVFWSVHIYSDKNNLGFCLKGNDWIGIFSRVHARFIFLSNKKQKQKINKDLERFLYLNWSGFSVFFVCSIEILFQVHFQIKADFCCLLYTLKTKKTLYFSAF